MGVSKTVYAALCFKGHGTSAPPWVLVADCGYFFDFHCNGFDGVAHRRIGFRCDYEVAQFFGEECFIDRNADDRDAGSVEVEVFDSVVLPVRSDLMAETKIWGVTWTGTALIGK